MKTRVAQTWLSNGATGTYYLGGHKKAGGRAGFAIDEFRIFVREEMLLFGKPSEIEIAVLSSQYIHVSKHHVASSDWNISSHATNDTVYNSASRWHR